MSRKDKDWELEIHTYEEKPHLLKLCLFYNGTLLEGATVVGLPASGKVLVEVPVYAFFSEVHQSLRGEVKREISVTEKLVAEEETKREASLCF